MSTRERYSIAVGDAVHEISYLTDENIYCFVAVGEIAKKAGVSKPTARKYLELFHEMGYVSKMKIGNMVYYRKLKEGND